MRAERDRTERRMWRWRSRRARDALDEVGRDWRVGMVIDETL